MLDSPSRMPHLGSIHVDTVHSSLIGAHAMPTATANLAKPLGQLKPGKFGALTSPRIGEFTRHDGEIVRVVVTQSFNVYWVYVVNPQGHGEVAGKVTKQRVGVWSIGSKGIGVPSASIPTGWTFTGKLTEAVERVANEYLNNIESEFRAVRREQRFDAYPVDTRLVQQRLVNAGYQVYRVPSTDEFEDDIQVYVDGNSTAVRITPLGYVAYVGWDASGGVTVEQEILASGDLDAVVRATVLWLKQHDLQQRVDSFLDYLSEAIPHDVAHYAVEQARPLLNTLSRNAHNIDLLYHQEV